MNVDARVAAAIVCPHCRGSFEPGETGAVCASCRRAYALDGDVIDLRPDDSRNLPEFGDWLHHWDPSNQRLLSQRFFSAYRKIVFARAVAWFAERFFAEEGLFVEAGAGTAETSMRIDKRGGRRTLIAVDLIVPVLERCHPVMDVKIAADIARLPFRDGSVAGLWNVGVMEHFTPDAIDAMMKEFHRVLAPGATIVLLWPATDSLPQKILRVLEKVINLNRDRAFRFHPDEISKLKSSEEGRNILRRNGFEPLFVDAGLRTGMAFKTLVGRTPVNN